MGQEKIDVEPGRTFAGFGFTMALKALRNWLVKGETVELRAVGFTPKPRVVSVELAHGGIDQLRMGGRLLKGDRFVIHLKIPWFASLFVDVPDTHIWLTTPPPAGFLRWKARWRSRVTGSFASIFFRASRAGLQKRQRPRGDTGRLCGCPTRQVAHPASLSAAWMSGMCEEKPV